MPAERAADYVRIAAELDRMGATEFTSVGRYQIWEDWRAQQAFATGGDPR